MDRRTGAAALAVIALAACGRPDETIPARKAATPDQPAVQTGPAWTLETSATAGTALVHQDAGGAEVFRLACRRGSPGLYAALPGLTRIDSEDRLTLGAGDQLALFVVSMEGPAQGLRADGARDPAFLAALTRGGPIAASYGARQISLPPPPAEARAAFAAGCREAGV